MCTAITLTTADTYVGRNLDLEYHYREEVVHAPRRFVWRFRHRQPSAESYAMIGTAFVPDNLPLYYDAVNECGLAMVGLRFPHYAHYAADSDEAIAPFEVIPFVLSQCRSVHEACALLKRTPIAAVAYNDVLACAPLHWMLADSTACVAVEPMAQGLCLTPDPVGVLTNSPPLSAHLTNLARYTTLTPYTPPATFGKAAVSFYSGGMGTEGLPGGYSSTARFVKAAYGREHSVCDNSEQQSVMQMFHLLDSVAHPRGSVMTEDGRAQITVYSSCCNLRAGAYYYKTYHSGQLCAVDFDMEDRNGTALYRYPMDEVFSIHSPYPASTV